MKDLHRTVLEDSCFNFPINSGFETTIRISIIPSEEQNLAKLFVKFTVDDAPEHFETFAVVAYIPTPKCSSTFAPFVEQMLVIYKGVVNWINTVHFKNLQEIFNSYAEEMEKNEEDLKAQNQTQSTTALELCNLANQALPSVIYKALDPSVLHAYQVRFSVFCGEVVPWR